MRREGTVENLPGRFPAEEMGYHRLALLDGGKPGERKPHSPGFPDQSE
jgi:hypothetical protein